MRSSYEARIVFRYMVCEGTPSSASRFARYLRLVHAHVLCSECEATSYTIFLRLSSMAHLE